jgi:hypothetical protein
LPLLVSICAQAAFAQPAFLEAEPKDEPIVANPITGPVAL